MWVKIETCKWGQSGSVECFSSKNRQRTVVIFPWLRGAGCASMPWFVMLWALGVTTKPSPRHWFGSNKEQYGWGLFSLLYNEGKKPWHQTRWQMRDLYFRLLSVNLCKLRIWFVIFTSWRWFLWQHLQCFFFFFPSLSVIFLWSGTNMSPRLCGRAWEGVGGSNWPRKKKRWNRTSLCSAVPMVTKFFSSVESEQIWCGVCSGGCLMVQRHVQQHLVSPRSPWRAWSSNH